MPDCQCNFCGNQQARVKRLIAGPGVYICDECVQLCVEILDEEFPGGAWCTPSDEVSARVEAPDERRAEILTREDLIEALEQLSYRERRVVELRYGLSGEQPRTLDEVGATFKLTRGQIRRIEDQSLEKLQSSADAHPD